MTNSGDSTGAGADPAAGLGQAISIVQRGNLKMLEASLRKQWRLGQNIVLCWSADERGLLVLFVPHYFLGNYCARPDADSGQGNENFIRELISGQRRKERREFFAIAERLDIAPGFIKLSSALAEEPPVLNAVEQLIKRYGLSYVSDRAVLLFDITDFSLFTPFEQASQLNSLSYSLNSAYNKLLAQNITVNFSRTTTGDGYYVWNRDLGPAANRDLLYFMVLVVADNAVARAASHGNTVPSIRTGYHIGSHYELYQAEGVNPTVLSYIVGDVTIELARMVDQAMPGQMLVGHFECGLPASAEEGTAAAERVYSPMFIENCHAGLAGLQGLQLAGKTVVQMSCYLTGSGDANERRAARRFIITDKHGLSRHAYNLECLITLETGDLALGLGAQALPGARERSGSAADRAGVPETSDRRHASSPTQDRDDEPVALSRRPQHRSSINEELEP